MPSLAELFYSLIQPNLPHLGPQSAAKPGQPMPVPPNQVPPPGFRTATGAAPEPQGQGGPRGAYNIPPGR